MSLNGQKSNRLNINIVIRDIIHYSNQSVFATGRYNANHDSMQQKESTDLSAIDLSAGFHTEFFSGGGGV